MGAIAITNKQELGGLGLAPGKRYVRCTITFAASYANPAGDTVAPATLGLTNVTEMFVVANGTVAGRPASAQTLGARVVLAGTPTAPTVRAHVGAGTPAEVANATNLSSTSVDVIFGGD